MKWSNETGKPLSSWQWLKAHHTAKLVERKEFAKTIVSSSPGTIVDLGCGPGLWLELFDEVSDSNCKLIGIDSDENAINRARELSSNWSNQSDFFELDIVSDSSSLPKADIFLAFNIFPFLDEPATFINSLKDKLNPGGKIVIRQYDGATMRFGPMNHATRLEMDSSLYASIGCSDLFHHYDLDRMFEIIHKTEFQNIKTDFELFYRNSPYPEAFLEYYNNTIDWTAAHISEHAADKLETWRSIYLQEGCTKSSYFVEVDLVAILS